MGREKSPTEILTWREQEILALLRERLSNQEIADKLSISINSVKWHTQQIYNKLGVNNRREAIARFQEGASNQNSMPGTIRSDPSEKSSIRSAVSMGLPKKIFNLPLDLTSFIGREAEIDHLTKRITGGEGRLLTLTGSGGTGKTRLALQVGRGVSNAFADGVLYVELAPLVDPSLVVATIAQPLWLHEVPGVPYLETLTGYLKNRHLLMILDNCEHLLSTISGLTEHLLKNCPSLHILATSREILNISGEVSFRVPSLFTPQPDQELTLEEVSEAESVRLFVDRVGQVVPGFSLNQANAGDVLKICHRLDGIPLALELAAARMRVMTLEQITARLDNVFRLLMGGLRTALPRHQTLKAMIDWSYNLLSPQEKKALQRLSVFSSSWTLEAAEQICAGEGVEPEEVLDLLAGLVDKSLVTGVNSEGRYRMLETIRQYARDRLLETGGAESVRDRHLNYYIQWVEEIEPKLRGPETVYYLDLLESELDNLRLALEWSLAGDSLAGLRLVSALKWFWHIHAKNDEGCQWVEKLMKLEAVQRGDRALAVGVQSELHLLTWVRSVITLYMLYPEFFTHYSTEQLKAMYYESIKLCRQMGDIASSELVWVLSHYSLGENDRDTYFEEALQICREKAGRGSPATQNDISKRFKTGYRIEEATLLVWRWWDFAYYMGDFRKGQVYLEQGLAIFREAQDADGIAWALCESGFLAGLLGEPDHARALIEEGLAYFHQVKNLNSIHGYNVSLLRYSTDPQTIRRAEQALAHFSETKNVHFLTDSYFTLILAEWSNGNFERAWELLAEAENMPGRKEIIKQQDFWPIHLGAYHLAMTQGNLPLAQKHLLLALPNFQRSQSVPQASPKNLSGDILQILEALSIYFAARSDMDRAVRIFAASADLYKNYHLLLFPRMRSEHEAALEQARKVLEKDAFAAAWEAGRAMSTQQAFEYGLAGFSEEDIGR